MDRKIIVGHDGTDRGHDAMALGRVLAEATGAELVAAHVYEGAKIPPPTYAGWASFMREHAEKTLSDALGQQGGVRQEVVESSSPPRGLHDLAANEHADLIVVGSSHHAGLGRVLAGSVAERVLHGAPCGVAVAPAGFRTNAGGLGLIGVGFDGMPEAEAALFRAADLARAASARLRLLAVVEPPELALGSKGPTFAGAKDLAAAREELMRSELDRGLALIPDDIEASGKLIIAGTETLADQEDIDAMVVGSRGYGPLRRVMLGSVSTRLVRNASCPVIVYPRSATSEEAGPREAVGEAAGATP